jgi:hypothetical protein
MRKKTYNKKRIYILPHTSKNMLATMRQMHLKVGSSPTDGIKVKSKVVPVLN